jgi:hypothetical protein
MTNAREHPDLHDLLLKMARKRKGFWCPGCTGWKTIAAGYGVYEDDVTGEIQAVYLICTACRKRSNTKELQDALISKIGERIFKLVSTGAIVKKRGILNVTKEML